MERGWNSTKRIVLQLHGVALAGGKVVDWGRTKPLRILDYGVGIMDYLLTLTP